MEMLRAVLGTVFAFLGGFGLIAVFVLSVPGNPSLNHGLLDLGTFLTLGGCVMLLTAFALIKQK